MRASDKALIISSMHYLELIIFLPCPKSLEESSLHTELSSKFSSSHTSQLQFSFFLGSSPTIPLIFRAPHDVGNAQHSPAFRPLLRLLHFWVLFPYLLLVILPLEFKCSFLKSLLRRRVNKVACHLWLCALLFFKCISLVGIFFSSLHCHSFLFVPLVCLIPDFIYV